MLSKMVILGFIAYPFISYFSIAHQHPIVSSHYLALLLGLLTTLRLRQHRYKQFVTLGFITISIILIGITGHPQWVIYPLPFILLFVVAVIFGNSLRAGKVPYITYMAQLIRQHTLDPKSQKYTRKVTIAWTVMLLALLIEMLSLALFAPLAIWSYAVNFLNYILIATFFIIEYIIRRIHLRHIPHANFIKFIKNLLQTNQAT